MRLTEYNQSTDTYNQVDIDLDTTVGTTGLADYARYDTIEDLREAALVAIQAASTNAAYDIDGDELVTTTDNYWITMQGPIPFILGWGYIANDHVGSYLQQLLSAANPSCFGIIKPNSIDLASETEVWSQIAEEYQISTSSEVLEVHIQYVNDVRGNTWLNYVKNRCTAAYYYQFDLSTVRGPQDLLSVTAAFESEQSKIVPNVIASNSTAQQRFYYSNVGEVPVAVGDKIGFGAPISDLYQRTGEVSAASTDGGVAYIELTDDEMLGMPWALYWPNGLQQELQTNTGWIQALDNALEYTGGLSHVKTGEARYEGLPGSVSGLVASMNMVDPFELTDVSVVSADSPVDIFKNLLGDPDATDVGIPDTFKKTDIRDLFSRGEYNSLKLINWPALQAIIDEDVLPGVRYTFKVDHTDAGSTGDTNKTIDLLSMIQGVCITHGARMVWVWDESKRAHKIDFIREGGQSKAEALNNARKVKEGDTLPRTVSGTLGGDWYYTRIRADYKRVDGGSEKFNIKQIDGRIQHTLKDKTLSINDNVTVLPRGTSDARNRLIERFSEYMQQWGRVQYQHTIQTKLTPFANIMVGGSMVFNAKPILDRTTGKRNNGDILGEIRNMTLNLRGNPNITLGFVTEPLERQGISPTMFVDNASRSGSVVSFDVVDRDGVALVDSANNEFSETLSQPTLRTDLSYFAPYVTDGEGAVTLDTDRRL
jgi:hypothetical protein